jgi:signal transduction histidine kinase
MTLQGSTRYRQLDSLPNEVDFDAGEDTTVRSAITAGLVHDLKTPIQVVLGWTSVLKCRHSEPEYLERVLTIIERNARMQMAIVEDLLTLVCPGWGLPRVLRHDLDLADLVRAEVMALEPLASDCDVALSLTLDPPSVHITGDDVQLRRVVANLVGNALKFTPAGGKVECRLSGSVTSAEFVVTDTGKGIDPGSLATIFDAFQQGPDERMSAEAGVGLGLFLSRRLIEQHGGSISASSAGAGCGATFTVLLPATTERVASGTPALVCSGI